LSIRCGWLTMTKKSSSYTRTRTERMLRFMLRRQPCVLLAVTLFIAITAFTAMALAMIQMMRLTKDQARYIQDGINLMNSLRSRTNLWQCQYQLPPSNTTSFFLRCASNVKQEKFDISRKVVLVYTELLCLTNSSRQNTMSRHHVFEMSC
uniref:Col_cuticle_N domain-containing protein n=1 Tax=Toxocara canis TaxID=6265 RepID=A0A183TYI0_TOXCA